MFTSDRARPFDTTAITDKVRRRIRGNHPGPPLRRDKLSGQLVSGQLGIECLFDRFARVTR